MPKKLYKVKLSEAERQALEDLTSKGEVQVRVYKRALILLLAGEGLKDAEITERVGVKRTTVGRIRQRYTTEGLEAIAEGARPGRPSIFDGEARAKITALACSDAPSGRSQWSLRLLADKSGRARLRRRYFICQSWTDTEKNELKPHLKQQWCLG